MPAGSKGSKVEGPGVLLPPNSEASGYFSSGLQQIMVPHVHCLISRCWELGPMVLDGAVLEGSKFCVGLGLGGCSGEGMDRCVQTRDGAVFSWRGFWVPLELKRLCHSCLFHVSWMSNGL